MISPEGAASIDFIHWMDEIGKSVGISVELPVLLCSCMFDHLICSKKREDDSTTDAAKNQ